MVVLLVKPDYIFSYKVLEKLDSFLQNNLPGLSHQIDSLVSKVLVKEDPIRFFYFNQMNLAIKFSNMLNKEVFNLDLILLLNQMHEQFQSDPDC